MLGMLGWVEDGILNPLVLTVSFVSIRVGALVVMVS